MLYLFLTGGPKLYETLHANLPIPHTRTITRLLETENNITEGVLQDEGLLTFLNDNEYPKKVWISEDGSKIIEKIQFDSRTNSLVGVVLPFDKNGMPILERNKATSAASIQLLMTKEKSSILYIMMAKPVIQNSKPFLLCFFGTSNKFKTEDVLQRWKHVEQTLNNKGIEVMGYSSDGDSRLLRSMRILSGLPVSIPPSSNIPISWRNWFCADFLPDRPVCAQDTVHIGTKYRTRFLKKDKPLKIGK
jgi:hypothetical protein